MFALNRLAFGSFQSNNRTTYNWLTQAHMSFYVPFQNRFRHPTHRTIDTETEICCRLNIFVFIRHRNWERKKSILLKKNIQLTDAIFIFDQHASFDFAKSKPHSWHRCSMSKMEAHNQIKLNFVVVKCLSCVCVCFFSRLLISINLLLLGAYARWRQQQWQFCWESSPLIANELHSNVVETDWNSLQLHRTHSLDYIRWDKREIKRIHKINLVFLLCPNTIDDLHILSETKCYRIESIRHTVKQHSRIIVTFSWARASIEHQWCHLMGSLTLHHSAFEAWKKTFRVEIEPNNRSVSINSLQWCLFGGKSAHFKMRKWVEIGKKNVKWCRNEIVFSHDVMCTHKKCVSLPPPPTTSPIVSLIDCEYELTALHLWCVPYLRSHICSFLLVFFLFNPIYIRVWHARRL